MNNVLRQLALKPKILFLIDSLGALVTAFFLFVILKKFNLYFGMPQTTLTYLSIVAIVFCLYSMSCFLFLNNHWQPFLKIISLGNLLYCCLTIGLVLYNYQSLTALGITYFLAEILIICMLVFVELIASSGANVKR
jgi:hypothetical protein